MRLVVFPKKLSVVAIYCNYPDVTESSIRTTGVMSDMISCDCSKPAVSHKNALYILLCNLKTIDREWNGRGA